MDRDRLRSFLQRTHRTWRWRHDDDADRYEGLRTTDGGLLWYAWSHLPEDGGAHAEVLQTFEAYRRDGALRHLPAGVAEELEAWLDRREG